jgi:hypothetical protein
MYIRQGAQHQHHPIVFRDEREAQQRGCVVEEKLKSHRRDRTL